jgi:benzoate transport
MLTSSVDNENEATDMNNDPRDIIAQSPMRTLQIIAIALMVGLNALDGFDVLSISYASPGITAEWGLNPAQTGAVLMMELIGMAIGSIVLGGVADVIGRRRTTLGCLVVMAIGMFMVTTVNGMLGLSIWRIVTGLGIGGVLAAITAITAEFSNLRRRALCVAIMAIGYPLGGVFGGLVVAPQLDTLHWSFVFYFGAAVTTVFIPLVYFLVPESVHWLAKKQPQGALEQINRTLARLKHSAIAALPEITEEERKVTIADIFGPRLIATTLIVTIAYFLHITSFYFVVKWVPNIINDLGFTRQEAGTALIWVSAGGATGGAILGFLTMRFDVKKLTLAVLALSTVAIITFGRTAMSPDLAQIYMICTACGFFTNAAINGLYAIFAHAFPTHVRAFGTGFAIGVGRGGSVLAPFVAGLLFQAGFTLQVVAVVMGMGSLLAACLLFFLKLTPDQPQEAEAGERELEASLGSA